jgi:DNA repair protein RadD
VLTLRPYQEKLITAVREEFRAGRRRVLLQLATGGGKTAICARMLRNAASRSKRVWFLCHRRELVTQISRALSLEGVEHGLICAGAKVNLTAPAQVASIPTLVNRLERYPPPDLIAFDEAHHIAAGSWATIAAAFPNAYHLGLSATPQRLDGLGLANYFDAMVCGPSIKWLIEQGYLSRYKLYTPATIDRSSIRKRAGEYVTSDAERATQVIVGNAVAHYRKHIDAARAILFAVSVKKSQELARMFNDAGIPALHIDGKTEDGLRDAMIGEFVDGKIKVICNVNLFSEGFDCPALDAVIDIAPTTSMSMYRQRVGRMLRAFPGKEHGVYLDCVGNSEIHGKPDDDIEWQLTTGQAQKKKNKVGAARVCAYCWAASSSWATRCKVCKRVFPVDGRKVQEVDGELTEVDLANRELETKKRAETGAQWTAKDFEQLVALGRIRGMGNPEGWARHVLEAREKKKGKAA